LIDDLAQAAGYSRHHLERPFRDVIGKTPGDSYRGLRLDRVRNLLSTTDVALMEVSIADGFKTVSHFSKSCRARFGTSPIEAGTWTAKRTGHLTSPAKPCRHRARIGNGCSKQPHRSNLFQCDPLRQDWVNRNHRHGRE
jgi:AraC-like DNA-binding protein